MSNRTLIELNHDYCPKNESEALIFGRALQTYMRSGDKGCLPKGTEFIAIRHHSDPEFQLFAAQPGSARKP